MKGAPALVTIAANDARVVIRGTGARALLCVVPDALWDAPHFYLALESVRGTFDAALLRLALAGAGQQDGAAAAQTVGSVGLYGLRVASLPQADGSVAGLQCLLDISAHAPRLQALARQWPAGLALEIGLQHALPAGVEISVERLRIYAGAEPQPQPEPESASRSELESKSESESASASNTDPGQAPS